MKQHGSGLNVLFYLICLAIVYGSIFPFQFSFDLDKEAFNRFLLSRSIVPSSGDILGNIALFVPFGITAYFLSIQPPVKPGKSALFIMIWLVVAVGSQFAQFFVPDRDPSVFDLYGNALGAIFGWIMGRLLPKTIKSGLVSISIPRQAPLLLVTFWLASELIPFVPTIDFQAYKNAIKPLILAPEWSWYEGLLKANCWVVCFYLLEKRAGFDLRFKQLLFGMVSILLLKIVIVGNSVSVTDVVAMGCALSIWLSLTKRHLSGELLGLSLLVSLSINGFFPLILRSDTAVFGWIPFSGFLQGSMLLNASAFSQKVFIFGSMVFLILPGKRNWKIISLPIAFFLLGLEMVQLWIASGTPELTDPLLFLVIAWFYASGHSYGAAQGAQSRRSASFSGSEITVDSPSPPVDITRAAQLLGQYLPTSKASTTPLPVLTAGSRNNRKRVAIVVGVYCLAAVVFLKILLGVPGVPYNVVELFRFDGSGVDLLFFSLTMLSLGWGAAWLGKVFAATRDPLRDIPMALVKLTVVIYFLLWLSVTRESIADITGSSVFVHRVAEREVLGEFGVKIIELIGGANAHSVTVIFEPVIRFGALLGPFLIFSGLSFFVAQLANRQFGRNQLSGKQYISACLLLMLLLYVSKVIAFDWSSTDNLNELIARDGPWGIGGGGYLYLLVFLFCALSALVTWTHLRHAGALTIALIIVMAFLPISWLLLNSGLEQNVGKYGMQFSGVDFLLGPDRKNLISRSELFVRWSVVHVFIVAGLAFGACLYTYWAGSKRSARSTANTPRTSTRLRVYQEQWLFLNRLAKVMNVSVSDLVHLIIDYFANEMASSPDSRYVVQNYIDSATTVPVVGISREKISVQLTPTAVDILASVNPDSVCSESSIFRKLLEIFMVVSDEHSINDSSFGSDRER